MFDHLKLLLGPVGAVAAGEGLLFGVGQVVMPQTRGPPERFLTQPAGVRPAVPVLLLVALQDEAGLKGFATFLADERASVAVLGVPVRAEGVGSVGAVLTLFTGVTLLSCVFGHVVLQLRGPFTLVATLGTEVLLLLLMNPRVKLQPGWVGAGVSAELAAVRLLSGVNADVPRHLLLVAGRVLTLCALVEPLPSVRAQVLLQHRLMATGELTQAASEGLVLLRQPLFVLGEEMLGEDFFRFGGKRAQLTV